MRVQAPAEACYGTLPAAGGTRPPGRRVSQTGERMSDKGLSERRKALEEQFFQKQDAMLVERLRAEREGAERKRELASASGIHDDAVLEAIAAVDIRADTLAALGFAPLVAVAWADGRVDRREREAVLSTATEAGLAPGDDSLKLLERWLEERPGAELLETWRDYAGVLPADVRAGLAAELLARARAVAAAAGGFLGLGGKISDEEERVLEVLERALG